MDEHILKENEKSSLHRQLAQLTALHELSRHINKSTNLEELLDGVLAKCREVVGSKAGSIFLVDEDGKEMVLAAIQGTRRAHLGKRQKVGEGVAGVVAKTGEPVLVKDTQHHPTFRERRRAGTPFLCVPLKSGPRLIGVMNVSEKSDGSSFSEDELEFLMTMASHAALAIEKMRLFEQLRDFNKELRRQVKEATAQLRSKNEELLSLKEYNESIVSSMGESLLVIDNSWRVKTWNTRAEEQFGIKAEEALGKELLELFPNWAEEGFMEKIEESLKNGVSSELEEVRTTLPNGDSAILRVKFSPLWEDGGIRGVVILLDDITDEVELRKQLTLSERLAFIGTLVAGVAHELNSPLDGAIRFTNLALQSIGEQEPTREYLSKARDGLLRMRDIIRTLLEFSAYKERPLEPTNVNEAVEDALMYLYHHAVEQNIEVIKDLSPDLPIIMDGELYNVFTNLIKNAIDAMPDGGTLRIQTRMDGDFIVIKVQDTGSGIPEDIIDNIFDPFFTTKDVGYGTGLGLTICYAIIERYGGTISVDSQPGKGTTFTIKLPANQPTGGR